MPCPSLKQEGLYSRGGEFLRNYEVIFILNAALDGEAAEKEANTVIKSFETIGASILYDETWGRRKLEYEIKKQRFGFFKFVQIEANEETRAEIERTLKLNLNVLKFMIVRIEADQVGKKTPFYTEKTREEA